MTLVSYENRPSAQFRVGDQWIFLSCAACPREPVNVGSDANGASNAAREERFHLLSMGWLCDDCFGNFGGTEIAY